MHGRVAIYHVKTKRGRILGADGHRYLFTRRNFLGPLPAVGDFVDFAIERGVALRVRPLETEADYWAELARRGERMSKSISISIVGRI